MISWIQENLVKRGKLIFILLLVVVIVSFVFTIGNVPGFTGPDRSARASEFFGYNLDDPRDQRRLVFPAQLMASLRGQRVFPQQVQLIAAQRAALKAIADELGIPNPSQPRLQKYFQSLPALQDAEGNYDSASGQRVLDAVISQRFSEGDFYQMLADQVRIEQVEDLISGPGFALPYEAELRARRSQTVWSVAMASFSIDDFDVELELAEEEIIAYYEQNPESYRIPERLRIRYAYFPRNAYGIGDATPPEAALRDWFAENRDQFEIPGDSEAGPGEIPLGIRAEVVNAYKVALARQRAQDAALQFANILLDEDVAYGSERFEKLLADDSITSDFLDEPVRPNVSPRNYGLSREIYDELFTLHEDIYFTSVFDYRQGYGIFFLDGRIPSEIPSLEEVRQEVTADLEQSRRTAIFNERGQALRDAIAASLKEGLSFEEALDQTVLGMGPRDQVAKLRELWEDGATVQELAAANYSPIEIFEGFKSAETPDRLPSAVFSAVETLEAGDLTPMVPTRGLEGAIAYVLEREVPEISRDSDAFARTLAQLKQVAARTSVGALTGELVAAEEARLMRMRGLNQEAQ